MIDTAFLLVASLFVLSKASQAVIDNAMVLARFFRISGMAIGFLLVSVATSLPELVVGIKAALSGQMGLVVGNVFGANISDLTLVVALPVLLAGGFVLRHKQIVGLTQVLLVTAVLPLVMLLNFFTQFYGVLLLIVFGAYAYTVLRERIPLEKGAERIAPKAAVFSGMKFTAAVFIVLASANYAVDFAVGLANLMEVSKAFIGGTLVALGTTLPELSVSLAAIRKKKFDLALGNAVGSCITNLTLILGAAVVVGKWTVNLAAFSNLVVFMVIANLALWNFLSQGRLGRREAAVMLAIYVVFIATAAAVEGIF